MSTVQELQTWYQAQCNGKWEHTCGVKIETLDNPGWSLTIDLAETNLSGRSFTKIDRSSEIQLGWSARLEIRVLRGTEAP